jgi:hypothetical protein
LGDPYCLHLQGKPSKYIKEEIRYTKTKKGRQRILFLDSLKIVTVKHEKWDRCVGREVKIVR